MPQSQIKVKCRRCGKESPVDEFVLDNVYKMVVCLGCVKERRLKEKIAAEVKDKKKNISGAEMPAEEQAEEVKRPKGWDFEDEYLERASRQKSRDMAEVITIDSEKVKYGCPKCGYSFVYNIVKKIPSRCPYCGSEIFQFRTDGLRFLV